MKEHLLEIVQRVKELHDTLERFAHAYTPPEAGKPAIPALPSPLPIEPIQRELNPLPNENAYQGPLVITKGGTYTGNWQSTDTEIPTVEVKTSEPVIIEHSNIRGAGPLVKSWYHDCNITIRNTRGFGLSPTQHKDFEKPRRFAHLNYFKNVVIENCYLEGTAGIYLGDAYKGNSTPAETVKIRYNQAKNIDGRIFGGKVLRVQFVQLNFRGAIPHAEIAWNEVINEPGKSAVEDIINLYNVRGTQQSPILIHNNYLQGAYPIPANATKYSGGGIITDSYNATAEQATAFVRVYENQTVGLRNYNYAIAGGNNIEVYNNRAVSAATPDTIGHRVGLYGYDYYDKKATFNAVMRDNYTSVSGNVKNYFPDSTVTQRNNMEVLGKATQADELGEWLTWQIKTKGMALGVS